MKGPSKTALATAYARAYHQVVDDPLILTDPIVGAMIGISDASLVRAAEEDRLPTTATDERRRLFFAARARFAEDRIAVAAAAGTRQVVILGAGLDTFAFRNPSADLRVFEVDHPETQEWKSSRLAAAGIAVPENAAPVPVDFEIDSLAESLAAAGFRREDPALFVWLGVIYYLTPEAAHSTLEFIAGQGSSTEVVFDYLQPATTEDQQARMSERAKRVAAVGEPWFNYYAPAALETELHSLGFHTVEDVSATALIDGYLTGSAVVAHAGTTSLTSSRIVRASR